MSTRVERLPGVPVRVRDSPARAPHPGIQGRDPHLHGRRANAGVWAARSAVLRCREHTHQARRTGSRLDRVRPRCGRQRNENPVVIGSLAAIDRALAALDRRLRRSNPAHPRRSRLLRTAPCQALAHDAVGVRHTPSVRVHGSRSTRRPSRRTRVPRGGERRSPSPWTRLELTLDRVRTNQRRHPPSIHGNGARRRPSRHRYRPRARHKRRSDRATSPPRLGGLPRAQQHQQAGRGPGNPARSRAPRTRAGALPLPEPQSRPDLGSAPNAASQATGSRNSPTPAATWNPGRRRPKLVSARSRRSLVSAVPSELF